ncbi:hypothetical protein A3D00_03430 [Candidatus Woesebacteria bacterium RIFCSPHIGHO2_02_FULL_38_9]|uniref:Phospholipid/glycerol acyltransferase domain-containing protein n=1 Tax=Candidatus Woesebacteria bacterium RIFCSPHIGHO2_01_FULL_39_28 TaxID=1802496 RepID=A0A1F7YIU4_9BACT|nr:MAG: hypothetical protein A2627_00685 [Candidatus Woesebacteria bacterium RIFCSPHIGHO2_01_FULL_39_28]OGM32550.1 MAG: hypothetical protein A3D00_03430 [Candidatus Woesebacteria bacterium RIFCSPHIGHO2_02_FULL_38_9]OGM58762.1 MAG: hypothetical protein A3A50_03180 [Candidatus Woesebacteria bacterium RIFCSPLOWO2_01_FULL_38_20]
MGNEETRILRQPRGSDPKEQKIREKLDTLTSTDISRKIIDDLRQRQAVFFDFSFDNLTHKEKILRAYRTLLPELASIANSKIKSGEEHLRPDLQGNGIIIVTNHLGIAKLTRISNFDHKFPIELEEFEPFPSRHALLSPVTQMTGGQMHETAIELPSTLLKIQESCEVLTIPVKGKGRTELLSKKVRILLSEEDRPIVVMYPEGGTSGKRNDGGPYDLDEFHTGAFVVALKTGLPIVPVCQYFNPNSGFELYILEPIRPKIESADQAEDIAKRTRSSMQLKLKEAELQKY